MKSIYFQELNDTLKRNHIDSGSLYAEYISLLRDKNKFSHSMSYMLKYGTPYLIKYKGQSQKCLGRRSPDTDAIKAAYDSAKQEWEEKIFGIREQLNNQVKINKVLSVGRIPDIAVKILNTLEEKGLGEHFLAIGTYSLYAYESALGIRILDNGALETRDIDLLWDTRKRVSFMTQIQKLDSSVLGLLKEVDGSFKISASDKYKAINKDGFEVDIIRREAKNIDPHPLKITNAEDDFWVVQALNSCKLLDAPKFKSTIVSSKGNIAVMTTVSPRTFVDFKEWLGQVDTREPIKKSRDLKQALVVRQMINDYFPQNNPSINRRGLGL